MKKVLLLTVITLLAVGVTAQTLIATSNHPGATANHNQRKIVRCSNHNIYVVFVDTENQESVIKGVMFDSSSGQWHNTYEITDGKNPTLSISADDEIHLIFESNDAITEIRYASTTDFSSWTSYNVISDTIFKSNLPVADIDATGNLNVFWVQTNEDLTKSPVYACISDDAPLERKYITTKNEINDIAIANHLQYVENDLFFAIQFNQDSLQLFYSNNMMESFDTLYSAKGSQPCITYNSIWESQNENCARFLYIDPGSQLMEVEVAVGTGYGISDPNQLESFGFVEYVCVDDFAPPIGYSYLFMEFGTIFHGFSYGAFWEWNTILETISGNNISNPSIAYKHFNFEYIDFIWMDGSGYNFDIYYMRDEKHIWLGIDDEEEGKGFSIVGHPNPFSEQLTISISVKEENFVPVIEIYNSGSQLIKLLDVQQSSAKEFTSEWNGTDKNGNNVETGLYIIMCSVGDKRVARKVIFKP